MSDTIIDTEIDTEVAKSEDTQPDDSEPTKVIPLEQHEEIITSRIEKARADEKSKVRSKIDKLTEDYESAEAERKALAERLSQAEALAKINDDEKLSEVEKLSKQFEALMGQNKVLTERLEKVSTESALRVKESEFRAWKESTLRDAKLMMPELVTGKDAETVLRQVEEARAKESDIRMQIRKEIAESNASNLPKPPPSSPEATTSTDSLIALSDRRRLSRMSKDDYQQMRQRLLEQALNS